jgi:hypothetical protein
VGVDAGVDARGLQLCEDGVGVGVDIEETDGRPSVLVLDGDGGLGGRGAVGPAVNTAPIVRPAAASTVATPVASRGRR